MTTVRILFISSNLASSLHGGWQCASRNLESMKRIAGEGAVDLEILPPFTVNSRTDPMKRLWHALSALTRVIFTLRINGSSLGRERRIIEKLKQQSYTHIFVDSSLNGLLIRKIKKRTGVRVTVFFHNCEFSFIRRHLQSGNVGSVFRLLPAFVNEKLSVRYADCTVALNRRDGKLIEKLYGIPHALRIIPISLHDRFRHFHRLTQDGDTATEKVRTALFIGSNFYANRSGIEWFIAHVLPLVDIRLVIAGKGMDQLPVGTHPRIELHGSAPSLEAFYARADFVIAPIFTGGGMKVKIAEALMYDKPIIGTAEALEGYERADSIVVCNTASEFVSAIRTLATSPALTGSRRLFLDRYSFDATLPLFKTLLEC